MITSEVQQSQLPTHPRTHNIHTQCSKAHIRSNITFCLYLQYYLLLIIIIKTKRPHNSSTKTTIQSYIRVCMCEMKRGRHVEPQFNIDYANMYPFSLQTFSIFRYEIFCCVSTTRKEHICATRSDMICVITSHEHWAYRKYIYCAMMATAVWCGAGHQRHTRWQPTSAPPRRRY